MEDEIEKMYITVFVLILIGGLMLYGDYIYGIPPIETLKDALIGWGGGSLLGNIFTGLWKMVDYLRCDIGNNKLNN